MKKEDKAIIINQIAETIKSYSGFYLVETAGLNAEKTSELRRACFNADIKLMVVKNTLLHKALESLDGDYSELYPTIKSKNELIADVMALLQSPMQNVMSALNAGSKLHSLLDGVAESKN